MAEEIRDIQEYIKLLNHDNRYGYYVCPECKEVYARMEWPKVQHKRAWELHQPNCPAWLWLGDMRS